MEAATQPAKKTPLFAQHKALGARVVPFAGWAMPVSYRSVLEEHRLVREAAGIFDVSHMGEIFVSGAKAQDFLNEVTINDVSRLEIGHGHYSALLNPQGGMVDDLILYRTGVDQYLLCVNASNIEKDVAWIVAQLQSNMTRTSVTVQDASPLFGQIALQGPRAREILTAWARQSPFDLADWAPTLEGMPYMAIQSRPWLRGTTLFVARTGYTGELGYELYIPTDSTEAVWRSLLDVGTPLGLGPVGLGARDTLRLEACYLLYGQDMDEAVSPLEAGIGWAVKMSKPNFVGRAALLSQKEDGVKRQAVAFKMKEDGIPRHGMPVFSSDGTPIGTVTSGGVLPTVGGAGGMARVQKEFAEIGGKILIDIRGKRKLAEVAARPLYLPRIK